jgi:hypothetical protein
MSTDLKDSEKDLKEKNPAKPRIRFAIGEDFSESSDDDELDDEENEIGLKSVKRHKDSTGESTITSDREGSNPQTPEGPKLVELKAPAPASQDLHPSPSSHSIHPPAFKPEQKCRFRVPDLLIPKWLTPHLNWHSFRPVLRSSVAGLVAMILIVDSKSGLALGNAIFLVLIASFIIPPCEPLSLYVEKSAWVGVICSATWAWIVIGSMSARLRVVMVQLDPVIFQFG